MLSLASLVDKGGDEEAESLSMTKIRARCD